MNVWAILGNVMVIQKKKIVSLCSQHEDASLLSPTDTDSGVPRTPSGNGLVGSTMFAGSGDQEDVGSFPAFHNDARGPIQIQRVQQAPGGASVTVNMTQNIQDGGDGEEGANLNCCQKLNKKAPPNSLIVAVGIVISAVITVSVALTRK